MNKEKPPGYHEQSHAYFDPSRSRTIENGVSPFYRETWQENLKLKRENTALTSLVLLALTLNAPEFDSQRDEDGNNRCTTWDREQTICTRDDLTMKRDRAFQNRRR